MENGEMGVVSPRIPLRLAFLRAFWRMFGVFSLVGLAAVWVGLTRLGMRPPQKVFVSFFYSPVVLFYALFFAATGSAMVDLFIRWCVRPQVLRWLAPGKGDEESQGTVFHLAPGERVEEVIPGRLARPAGRGSWPGTVARTDRRLWFFPRAWDLPAWSMGLDRIESIRLERSAPVGWGMVVGLPDRVVVSGEGGEEVMLLVADPERLKGWFERRLVNWRGEWDESG